MDLLPLPQTLIRMTVAFALALPVGWERERADRSAGLRTFPLVAVASCAYVLLASTVYDDARAQARVLEGVVTGVGVGVVVGVLGGAGVVMPPPGEPPPPPHAARGAALSRRAARRAGRLQLNTFIGRPE